MIRLELFRFVVKFYKTHRRRNNIGVTKPTHERLSSSLDAAAYGCQTKFKLKYQTGTTRISVKLEMRVVVVIGTKKKSSNRQRQRVDEGTKHDSWCTRSNKMIRRRPFFLQHSPVSPSNRFIVYQFFF